MRSVRNQITVKPIAQRFLQLGVEPLNKADDVITLLWPQIERGIRNQILLELR